MRALVVTEPGRIEWQEVAAPEPGPYDALVRIETCGICSSTDRKLIAGQMPWAPRPPFVLGHESIGTVVATGRKVRRFRVGDRVTRPVAWWQGEGPLAIGIGGFAEQGIVRDHVAMAADGDASLQDDYLAKRQVVIPGELPLDAAALGITLAETASVYRGLPGLHGRSVVIAGTGCVGLSFALWAKLAGARVVVLGRRGSRRAKALELGADVALDTRDPDWERQLLDACGGAVEVAIETTADLALAARLGALLRSDGIACAYGAPPDGERYDPRWRVAEVAEQHAWPWVADLLARGWIRAEWFIDHRCEADGVADALAAIAAGDCLKAIVGLSAPVSV